VIRDAPSRDLESHVFGVLSNDLYVLQSGDYLFGVYAS
jgi:hypothetical protein